MGNPAAGNRKVQVVAWALVAVGISLGVVYGLRDVRIHAPMFAVVTWYAQPGFFTFIENNIADELAMTSLLVGLFLMTQPFSPTHEPHTTGNCHGWIKAVRYNTLFQVLAVLFLFGKAFVVAMIVNFFSLHVIFLITRHGRHDSPV